MRLRLPGDHTFENHFFRAGGGRGAAGGSPLAVVWLVFFSHGGMCAWTAGGKGLISRDGCKSFSLLSELVVLKLGSTLNHSGSFKKNPL